MQYVYVVSCLFLIQEIQCAEIREHRQDTSAIVDYINRRIEQYSTLLGDQVYLGRGQTELQNLSLGFLAPFTNSDTVIARMGDPVVVKSRRSTNGNFNIVSYYYVGLRFDVFNQKVDNVYCLTDRFGTAHGITIGMSIDDLTATLKIPLQKASRGIISLSGDDDRVRLHIVVDDNKVVMLVLRTPY